MADKHKSLGLQPSSASRWTKCKASPGFIQQNADKIPDESSEWAEEGTLAHALAAGLLRNNPIDDPYPPDMAGPVKQYVEFVQDKVGDGTLFVEQKVPLPYMPTRNGSIDAAIVSPGRIYIADLKYGVGVAVDAVENKQIAIYADAFIDWLMDQDLFDPEPNTLITLAIFQPRARDGKTTKLWALSYAELLDFMKPIRETAAAIQADPLNQPFCPSEKNCKFCPGADLCIERAKHLVGGLPAEVKEALKPVLTLPDVGSLSPEVLGQLISVAKPLEKFFEQLRARAFGLLEGGTSVPGHKLVTGRGSRSWRDEKEATDLLKQKLSIDEYSPRSLVTPAGAEKLLKGKDLSTRYQNLFKGLVQSNEGKPTIVPEDDPRPALVINAAAEFKNLEAGSTSLLD